MLISDATLRTNTHPAMQAGTGTSSREILPFLQLWIIYFMIFYVPRETLFYSFNSKLKNFGHKNHVTDVSNWFVT